MKLNYHNFLRIKTKYFLKYLDLHQNKIFIENKVKCFFKMFGPKPIFFIRTKTKIHDIYLSQLILIFYIIIQSYTSICNTFKVIDG